MVRYYNDNDLFFLNYVLEEFKVDFDSIKGNPFSKIIIYDDGIKKGVLIFSIYYDRAELDYIYVCDNFRRSGIAFSLMKFMIDECASLNNITLEVDINNIGAINLYKKFGFNIVATREKYYNNGNSAYLMERKL